MGGKNNYIWLLTAVITSVVVTLKQHVFRRIRL